LQYAAELVMSWWRPRFGLGSETGYRSLSCRWFLSCHRQRCYCLRLAVVVVVRCCYPEKRDWRLENWKAGGHCCRDRP
jgi:hypothetical protein